MTTVLRPADNQKAPPNARGQGRKPLVAGEHSVVVTLRLTPAQRDKLRELGGAAWVRSMLDAA